jgi:hypothetical protein
METDFRNAPPEKVELRFYTKQTNSNRPSEEKHTNQLPAASTQDIMRRSLDKLGPSIHPVSSADKKQVETVT